MAHKANNIEELYQAHMSTWGDMQHHMGLLRWFASRGETVLELGCRAGVSTCAFLASGAKVISVDIDRQEEPVAQLEYLCPDTFRFVRANSLWQSEPADLIFFDTKHTYAQLKAELELHAPNAGKFMIFHDTQTFRHEGEDGTRPGLFEAIEPYCSKHAAWRLVLDIDNCCGLTVLERK